MGDWCDLLPTVITRVMVSFWETTSASIASVCIDEYRMESIPRFLLLRSIINWVSCHAAAIVLLECGSAK